MFCYTINMFTYIFNIVNEIIVTGEIKVSFLYRTLRGDCIIRRINVPCDYEKTALGYFSMLYSNFLTENISVHPLSLQSRCKIDFCRTLFYYLSVFLSCFATVLLKNCPEMSYNFREQKNRNDTD